MRRGWRWVGALVCLAALGAGFRQAPAAPAGEEPGAGEPIPEAIFAGWLERHRVPGASVAVLRGGGYGVRQAGGVDAVTESTLFQAASISKPVAAAGALRLVAEWVLSLDGDVNEKLTSWALPASERTAGNPVTLRHLLNHSAGVVGGIGFFGYAEGAARPTLVQILAGEKPAYSEAVRVEMEPGNLGIESGDGIVVMTNSDLGQALIDEVLAAVAAAYGWRV